MTEMPAANASLPASEQAPAVEALAVLLHLAQRARQAADQAELAFILVNETHGLAAFRQSALWLDGEGVTALSGVVSVEANAPYVQWLGTVFRHLGRTLSKEAPHPVAPASLEPEQLAQWGEWLPAAALWLPLPTVGDRFAGGALLLARDEPWTPAEVALLGEWAAAWAHAQALHAPTGLRALRRQAAAVLLARTGGGRLRRTFFRPRAVMGLVLLAGLAFPVRLTVLAPAEIVPLNPAVIRSPLDGVIDTIAVAPNQTVRKGAELFIFDMTTIASRLLVAEKALETARAEYRLHAQQALYDPASKGQLAVLQGRVAEKALEVEYLGALKERATVVAPRDGTVLFDDPTEWIGRPVVTGERVMMVAAEGDVEVEAWLSPANAIPFAQDAPVTIYLNTDPLNPVAARLRYVAHEAVRRPEGHYAYRVRARLEHPEPDARAGLKGTAKLAAGRVPLVYWILRRPLADARAWLGL